VRSTDSVIVIAGGGTGGHVYPAIAIADALVKDGVRKRRTDIHFMGSARGLEARVVPAAGYTISLLPGRGIERRLSVGSVKAVASLFNGLFRAFLLLLRRRPAAVISVGGYAAAPAAFSAILLRIPIVIVESNAVPGAVNRVLARFAKASAVAWPGTKLPHATVTGNPVREIVASVQRTSEQRKAAKQELGVAVDKPLIAIVGGSLGARAINRAAAKLPEVWPGDVPASLLHIVGRRDWDEDGLQAVSSPSLEVVALRYQERMELVYAAADVLVSRAGATTVAEVAAAGLPTLLVPLPNSPGDHQGANARMLEKIGAAIVVQDADCTADELRDRLVKMLSDETHLMQMGRQAKQVSKPNAADGVADVVRSVLARKGRVRAR
jgi:UDP-N-acetylglucosamine--N-acetylmuramyl-(pentapeptide) pyrophosphoryl-undecaprenol N-acetylglucosamine transferase